MKENKNNLQKVLIVASESFCSSYGGGQVYVKNLVDGLLARGLEIVIVSVLHVKKSKVKTSIDTQKYKSYKCFHIKYNDADTDAENKVQCLLKELAPDVVHANGEKALFIQLCRKIHVPCVITAHHGGIICPAGTLLNYRDRMCNKTVSDKDCIRCCCRILPGYYIWVVLLNVLPLKLRLYLGSIITKVRFIPFITPVLLITRNITQKLKTINVLKQADAIIAPSVAIADALNRNGINKNVQILPHGIPEIQSVPLTEVGIPMKFFYIGRINYVKGIHVMLQAFKNIPNNKYELHIIGAGGNKREVRYEERLKRKYRGLNIDWHGKIEHQKTLEYIKSCHVMIHPAIYLEVFGLTIAESLAIGRPVLATRCGGAEMQIKNNVNGWLMPPNDTKALYDKLIAIANKPNEVLELAKNCHAEPFKGHIQSIIKVYRNFNILKNNKINFNEIMINKKIKRRLRKTISLFPGGGSLLDRYRNRYARHRLAQIGNTTKDIFHHYYETNEWGNDESISGPGSTAHYTANIRKMIPQLVKDLKVSAILDAPCGDFNWFKLIELREGINYIGGDIVETLVKRNQLLYGKNNTKFITLDIVQDVLTKSGLMALPRLFISFVKP